ncbi:MAG: ATP-binding protein [Legionella sp.]|nr:ATP-binding protein [Legionella sp.]
MDYSVYKIKPPSCATLNAQLIASTSLFSSAFTSKQMLAAKDTLTNLFLMLHNALSSFLNKTLMQFDTSHNDNTGSIRTTLLMELSLDFEFIVSLKEIMFETQFIIDSLTQISIAPQDMQKSVSEYLAMYNLAFYLPETVFNYLKFIIKSYLLSVTNSLAVDAAFDECSNHFQFKNLDFSPNKSVEPISKTQNPNTHEETIYLNTHSQPLLVQIKKQAELIHNLEEKVQCYENILAHIPNHVFWLNNEGVYLGCNDYHAKNLNCEKKDIIGKTNFDMPWSDRAEGLKQLHQTIRSTGQAYVSEESMLYNNESLTFLSQKVPLKNRKNEIIGILGILTNITKQKQIELELLVAKKSAELANKAKDEFIQNISHDIRTPIIGIIGLASILEQEAHTDQGKEYAQMVNISGEQLLSLLNNVLDIVSTGKDNENTLNIGSFDIYQVIQSIGELERPTIQLKNLDLHIQIDESVPQYVITDQTKLHRIILNLLSNAIKFTEQGAVKIRAQMLHHENNSALLKVFIEDTGIGIDKESQAQIFDRFFRANPSYKGVFTGYGIGLHIVQKYTEILKGKVSLESSPGNGTTFTVELPVLIDTNKITLKQQSPPLSYHHESLKNTFNTSEIKQTNTNNKSPLFLLVEDNAIALKLVESMIKKFGGQYVSAISGERAFELFTTNNIDIVITDLGLPGISGNELTRRIRIYEQEAQKKPVTIVGLTAHALESAKPESLQAGMNELITKPIRYEALPHLFDEFISARQDAVKR